MIQDNAALSDIGALSGLSSVAGSLWIGNNPSLVDLEGLGNITSIGEDLSIGSNDALTDLDGLGGLASVGRDMSVSGNTALTSLDGLANLVAVWKRTSIVDNPALASLGLDNLEVLGCEPDCWEDEDGWYCDETIILCLEIASNQALPQCEACQLLEQVYFDSVADFVFHDNQPDTCSDTCD